MKAFSVLFQERNSPIIIYNGKTVYRYLRCTEKGKYILKFRNIKTRAKRMQFFMVHLLKMDGEIYVNDKPFLVPKTKFPQLAINEEELRYLESWLEEDVEHKSYFFELKGISDSSRRSFF